MPILAIQTALQSEKEQKQQNTIPGCFLHLLQLPKKIRPNIPSISESSSNSASNTPPLMHGFDTLVDPVAWRQLLLAQTKRVIGYR